MVSQAENKEERNWAAKLIFEFLFKDFDSKQRVLNIFKPNLNWTQKRINSKHIFEYFSNLKLLKIDLNMQIQTKALNMQIQTKALNEGLVK
jgi:hypothetical protein